MTASKRNVQDLPYAFTEHGALMAASVLNTARAIDVSVYVIRAFVKSGKSWSNTRIWPTNWLSGTKGLIAR